MKAGKLLALGVAAAFVVAGCAGPYSDDRALMSCGKMKMRHACKGMMNSCKGKMMKRNGNKCSGKVKK